MSFVRQAQRVDSAARWEEVNPVLENGELGVARFYDDEGKIVREKMKCGDGVKGADGIVRGTPWNELPWLTGGEKGEKGDAGPAPKHDWQGTALRFENPDGSWGDRVDLKGEPGNRANAEPATTSTLGGVMPATGLRVDGEGYEYVALGWDRHKCYPDPIVVKHGERAYLWLRESGVGTTAGVREPGTVNADAYWQALSARAEVEALETEVVPVSRGGTGNTVGKAADSTLWNGAAKTVSAAAASGGADGDIWFQYL